MTAWGITPAVAIDGSPIASEVSARLERVTVDQDALRPDMFELVLRDPAHDVLDRARARIGARVRVAVTAADGTEEELIDGEMTSLEAEFDAAGGRAAMRGYDVSHRLTRGARTETYRDVTDADIARTLARRAGIDAGRIEDTAVVHTLVSQVHASDWEFLQARARGIGYVAAIVSGRLDFRPPTDSREAPDEGRLDRQQPLQLLLGSDLQAFRPRVSSSGQVGSVEVRGWSADRKEAIVASADARTTRAELADRPAELAARFGDQRLVSASRPYGRQPEVDDAARALSDRVASAFAEADGTARGNPALRAGRAVNIGLVGPSFDGRYVLSATRHVFDEDGYRTNLTISGAHDRSLLGLVADGPEAHRIAGVVSGIVTAVDDPDARGRVKLRLPWLSDSYETDWARVAQLSAGGRRGSAFLPEVGDEVLVAFEQGDVERPYVLGGLYNGVDEPDLGGPLVEGGAVRRRGLTTTAGHRLVFVEGGTTTVQLSSRGDVAIEASGDVAIEAGGKLELSAGRGVTIDAGAGDVTVTGRTIRLN
jgi:uncharacterized protein involved in type VI secretion and phage assembly